MSRRTSGKKRDSLSDRQNLAKELHALLGIPYEMRTKTSDGRKYRVPTKGYELINTVLNVIKESLLRGESVKVQGFGKFTICNIPPYKQKHTFLTGNGKKAIFSNEPIMTRPKRVVRFTPAPALLEHISNGN